MLDERRARIEQGLKDADAARREREAAADQRQAVLAEARREAGEIVARAQRMADEAREQGVADTQSEIDRLKTRAAADIDAERQRAMADVRGQVAELALARGGQGHRGDDGRRSRAPARERVPEPALDGAGRQVLVTPTGGQGLAWR